MALGFGSRQNSEIVDTDIAWVAHHVLSGLWGGWRLYLGGLLQ